MAVGIVVAVVAATGCASPDPAADPSRSGHPTRSGHHTPTQKPQPHPSPQAARVAARRLASLPVGPRHGNGRAYDRDAFGEAWTDVDGNGCNQRDDVLLRDAVPGTARVAPQGGCDHDVLAGTWVDPYTGRRLVLDDLKDLAQAQSVQIDHVVPLAEAWGSGAASWSDRRRLAFANDPAELLAVDSPTNQAKGDDDPAAWRPRRSFQCEYAVRWIATKHRWGLSADLSERRALRRMLGYC